MATTRSGSIGNSDLVARVTALETIFEATETAAAHAEDLLGLLWYRDLDIRILRSKDVALRQSEHGEKTEDGTAAVRALESTEAPVRSCIMFDFLALGLVQGPNWSMEVVS